MLWETLQLALQAIRRNVLRSSLTTLGIVIGVAAVITMVTLGSGATAQVTDDIGKLGSKTLVTVGDVGHEIPVRKRHGLGDTLRTTRKQYYGRVIRSNGLGSLAQNSPGNPAATRRASDMCRLDRDGSRRHRAMLLGGRCQAHCRPARRSA